MYKYKPSKNLINDYLEQQQKYEEIYGEKTIVLMQVGSFYEIYGVNNEEEKVGRVDEVTQLLDITKTRANKKIAENSRTNPLTAGIPTRAAEKYIEALITGNYTVIIIDQKEDNPKIRNMKEVCSPGTYIGKNTDANNETNTLIAIYINTYTIMLSYIDINTGKNGIYIYDEESEIDYITKLQKLLLELMPREAIIYADNKNNTNNTNNTNNINDTNYELFNKTIKNTTFENIAVHKKEFVSMPLKYKNAFLARIYESGMLTPIEYINMERYDEEVTLFVLMLQFAAEHNVSLVNKISIPVINMGLNSIKLSMDTINDLNILSGTKNTAHSLFSILDNTRTAPGRRKLRSRLLNPITDVKLLTQSYNDIENMLQVDKNTKNEKFKQYRELLRNVRDLERLNRRIVLQRIHPFEWMQIDSSYSSLQEILEFAVDDPKYNIIAEYIDIIDEFITEYKDTFNFKAIYKFSMETAAEPIFVNDLYNDLTNANNQRKESMKKLREYAAELSKQVKIDNSAQLKYTDRDGYYISMTNTRADILKKLIVKNKDTKTHNLFNNNISNDTPLHTNIKLTKLSSETKIISDEIKDLSGKIIEYKDTIQRLNRYYYKQYIGYITDKYNDMFNAVAEYISEVDVLTSNAYTAHTYRYCKPIANTGEQSKLSCVKLRHPIIERVQIDVPFTANDLELNADNSTGILLYGINASGKSTLMKSIAIAIIMVQSGMYAPADIFSFTPYSSIITKISTNDNIYEGKSTFMKEMYDLKQMLCGDKNTLILADELCNGTEHNSALGIVAEAIIELLNKKSSFIITTHLHDLVQFEELTGRKELAWKHLKTRIDNNNDNPNIIFERILSEGTGESTYGIEVAQYLNVGGTDFIKNAIKFRNKAMGVTKQVGNKSRYNSNVILEECKICKCNNMQLDTHHINFQCSADNNGFINTFHKNTKHNLVVLCKECHNKVHNGGIKITNYIQTANGVKLDYEIL